MYNDALYDSKKKHGLGSLIVETASNTYPHLTFAESNNTYEADITHKYVEQFMFRSNFILGKEFYLFIST